MGVEDARNDVMLLVKFKGISRGFQSSEVGYVDGTMELWFPTSHKPFLSRDRFLLDIQSSICAKGGVFSRGGC
jgi:hypothetical protein